MGFLYIVLKHPEKPMPEPGVLENCSFVDEFLCWKVCKVQYVVWTILSNSLGKSNAVRSWDMIPLCVMANLKAPCILEAGSQLHKHETFYTNVSIAKPSWLPFPAVDPLSLGLSTIFQPAISDDTRGWNNIFLAVQGWPGR